MKKDSLRITPKLIALLVAGGITSAPVEGNCLTDNSYDPGTFVKCVDLDESKHYGEYVVKKGDNLSRISEKVCSHLRIEITPKYWPVLAFLNGYPRVIEPGDIILYPKSAEYLDLLNEKLKENGWTSKYKQTYKVYGEKVPKKGLSMESVGILLSSIYGDKVCVDEDFIRLYLKVQGLDEKYYLSSSFELSNETLFELTDWIPTLEEINEYQQKTKTKK